MKWIYNGQNWFVSKIMAKKWNTILMCNIIWCFVDGIKNSCCLNLYNYNKRRKGSGEEDENQRNSRGQKESIQLKKIYTRSEKYLHIHMRLYIQ